MTEDKYLIMTYKSTDKILKQIKKNQKLLITMKNICLQMNNFFKYPINYENKKEMKDDEESVGLKKMIEVNITKAEPITLWKNIIAWTAFGSNIGQITKDFNTLKTIKNRNIIQGRNTYKNVNLFSRNGKIDKKVMELSSRRNNLKLLSKTNKDSKTVAKLTKQIDKLDEQIKILKNIKSYNLDSMKILKNNGFKFGAKIKTILKDTGKRIASKAGDFKKLVTLKGISNAKTFAGAMLGPAAMAVNLHTMLDEGESSFKRTLAMIDFIGDFTLLSPITSVLNVVGPLMYDMLDLQTQGKIDEVFKAIGEVLNYAYEAVYVVIKPLFDSLKSLFGVIFHIVGICAKKLFGLMSGPLACIFKWVGKGMRLLVDLWSMSIGKIIEDITTVIDVISYVLKQVYEFIANPMKYINSMKENFKGFIGKGIDGAKNLFSNTIEYLNPMKQINDMDGKNNIKSELEKSLKHTPVSETLDNAYDLMGNKTKKKVDNLTNTVKKSVDDTITKVLNKTKGIMRDIEQNLKVKPLPQPRKIEKSVPLYHSTGKSTYNNNQSNYNYNNYNVSVDVLEKMGVQIMDKIMPEVNKAMAIT
jgi:hypothetical protein